MFISHASLIYSIESNRRKCKQCVILHALAPPFVIDRWIAIYASWLLSIMLFFIFFVYFFPLINDARIKNTVFFLHYASKPEILRLLVLVECTVCECVDCSQVGMAKTNIVIGASYIIWVYALKIGFVQFSSFSDPWNAMNRTSHSLWNIPFLLMCQWELWSYLLVGWMWKLCCMLFVCVCDSINWLRNYGWSWISMVSALC